MINILKKEALIYGFGHVLARLASFFLLPLFTNIFSSNEYGIITLIYVFVGALLKYYKNDRDDKKVYVTNTYVPVLIINIMFFSFCFLLRDYLAYPLIGINDSFIFLMVILILFFDVLWAMPMIILRVENKPFQFVVYNLINVLSNLFCIYIFVATYKMGVWGVVLSGLVSSGLSFTITLLPIIKNLSLKLLDQTIFKKVMRFGYPLMFAGIFSMTLELSDRYIIKALLDTNYVGLYNAGYKLGMLMLLLVMGFNMAWQPFFLKKENQDKALIGSISNSMFLFFSLVCFFVVCFGQPLASIKVFGFSFVGDKFVEGLSILPWVCAGYLFHGAYILQLPGAYITNNTVAIAKIRCAGALTNIALNFILIPVLGIHGAAIATFVSFALISGLLFVYNKKIYRVKYNIYNIGCLIGSLIALIGIIGHNPTFLMRFVIFISLILLLFILRVIKKDSFILITNFIKKSR
jgi:O-antigen/teichoic acid export membrane protein